MLKQIRSRSSSYFQSCYLLLDDLARFIHKDFSYHRLDLFGAKFGALNQKELRALPNELFNPTVNVLGFKLQIQAGWGCQNHL